MYHACCCCCFDGSLHAAGPGHQGLDNCRLGCGTSFAAVLGYANMQMTHAKACCEAGNLGAGKLWHSSVSSNLIQAHLQTRSKLTVSPKPECREAVSSGPAQEPWEDEDAYAERIWQSMRRKAAAAQPSVTPATAAAWGPSSQPLGKPQSCRKTEQASPLMGLAI